MGQIRKNGIIYSGGPELIQPVIYSDEERCIGVWRDGKPLYQKTWYFQNDMRMIQTGWTSLGIDVSSLNIDEITDNQAQSYSSQSFSISVWNDSGTLKAMNDKSNINIGSVTLRYTKTTDTAGDGDWTPSGVKAVHYSTNEHVIGTWIDGKTLYERTVSFTIGTAATYTSYVTDINNPDENCMILDYGSSYYVKTGQSAPVTVGVVPYGTTSGSNDPEYSMAVLLAKADGKLRVDYRCGTQASGNTCYITLRYTKSS